MTPRAKPSKSAADYMVIALSPALIMALVGSLCFFLIDVFYHGQMAGGVRWVMFWFVVAVVLVSRIGIEQTPEHAAVYGLALALAVWLYLVRTHPAYLLGIVLLGVLWFCSHKLVWDCTLIDETQDSSGQGLLQSAGRGERPSRGKAKLLPNHSSRPGIWVLWFSLAALPLFGLGQMLLPPGGAARQRGFVFLVVYMAAALGLLVTTSFLGLRRYLRQRWLRMPPVIALAWLKFGAGVALLILVVAMFLPRPGANLVWNAARYQIDYRLRQASRYALRFNPPGKGPGAAGNQTGPSGSEESSGSQSATPERSGHKSSQANNSQPSAQNSAQTSSQAQASSPPPAPLPTSSTYNFARIVFLLLAACAIGFVLFRSRYVLWQMVRSAWTAIAELFRRWFSFGFGLKPARPSGPAEPRARHRTLADFRNPFYATGENAWPPGEIVLYTYDALQAWAAEQGLEPHREQTAREFLQELSGTLPELSDAFRQLAFLYGHAAYSERLPANCDLEPLKQIWRQVTARES